MYLPNAYQPNAFFGFSLLYIRTFARFAPRVRASALPTPYGNIRTALMAYIHPIRSYFTRTYLSWIISCGLVTTLCSFRLAKVPTYVRTYRSRSFRRLSALPTYVHTYHPLLFYIHTILHNSLGFHSICTVSAFARSAPSI